MEPLQVVVPSAPLAEAIGRVDGAEVSVWDGTGAAPSRADLWVPAYATSAEVVSRAGDIDHLGVVQLQSAGYDGVPERLPAGVTLCNGSGVHDDATAEHAVGMILAVLRGTVEAVRHQDEGRWVKMPGRQSLADARVLILGYGSIGRALAERLLPMKARVTGVASRPRTDDLLDQVHGFGDLPALLPNQDVVVLLVPHTERTEKMVDAAFLAKLADGALLVNVARGLVVDTDAALAEAGRLRFALDVTDPEPLPDGHPLWSAPEVLITPHVAGGTTAMLPRIAALVRSQAERLVAGQEPQHVVHRS
ncbi:2-hydroxyacid dehydrogenase [Nocardioides daphniae]|uniref:Dehydrogenase n=1 Tax=Nocardioides daphniae TaxID=402297 RepID=A0A4P7U9P7_9ACTN|nr:2-hydroxyacid dehydrogenase [Nocardioides daphniae]QCC76321.1 hydroxyacid dehydrogenase [Nocardioides daphniae]GGD07918.1 dehydrogenase [Nocardioides daphniae]